MSPVKAEADLRGQSSGSRILKQRSSAEVDTER